jgi:hypothetical protein
MLRENLKDAGMIVQNILTQTLAIPDVMKEISFLTAAKSYPANHDLVKLIETFKQYPEALAAMLKELELLCIDLKRFS